MMNPEVLIVGGGSAGVAAAVGVSRNGVSSVVLEKNAYPGGKATASYVGTICGLYYRSEETEIKYAHNGFPKEFGEWLSRMCKTEPIRFRNGLQFLPYEDSIFHMLCIEYLRHSAQSYHTQALVTSATLTDNNITTVTAVVDGKQVLFKPKVVIDASGFNCIASHINLESLTSDRYQAAAQVFEMAGLSTPDAASLSMILLRSIRKGIESGALELWMEFISVVPGSVKEDSVLLKLSLPDVTGNDPDQQERFNITAQEAVKKIAAYLIENTDVFRHAELSHIAPEAGIRTGPRNVGKYVLTGNDVLQASKHPEAIARGTWPVEYWEPGKKVRMEYFEMNDHYDIPATALQSAQIENLFFAGRNISADDTAIASARVIGTCLATGYAAGVMAAFHANGKEVSEAIPAIQNELFGTPIIL